MKTSSGPAIVFEKYSENATPEDMDAIISGIPSPIKKYDLQKIDVDALHQQILSGGKIPVRIYGKSYLMVLDQNLEDSSFTGYLEKIPGGEMQDNIVRLAVSRDSLTLSISEPNGSFLYMKPVNSPQSAVLLHYSYSSADAMEIGARMDNDVWVMLPSGESKLRNDLFPDEIAWWKAEQINRENKSYDNSRTTASNQAPLSLILVVLVPGVCTCIAVWRRKK